MKRTREQTIEFYRKDFIEGKSEEAIKKFDSKPAHQQYADIMNWKRKITKQTKEANGVVIASISNVLKYLKSANQEIENLTNLSAKDADKTLQAVEIIKDNIQNFDRIRKQHQLAELIKQEEKLQKEGDSLRKRIADIQKELE